MKPTDLGKSGHNAQMWFDTLIESNRRLHADARERAVNGYWILDIEILGYWVKPMP
jgi:hypothetical protein